MTSLFARAGQPAIYGLSCLATNRLSDTPTGDVSVDE